MNLLKFKQKIFALKIINLVTLINNHVVVMTTASCLQINRHQKFLFAR